MTDEIQQINTTPTSTPVVVEEKKEKKQRTPEEESRNARARVLAAKRRHFAKALNATANVLAESELNHEKGQESLARGHVVPFAQDLCLVICSKDDLKDMKFVQGSTIPSTSESQQKKQTKRQSVKSTSSDEETPKRVRKSAEKVKLNPDGSPMTDEQIAEKNRLNSQRRGLMGLTTRVMSHLYYQPAILANPGLRKQLEDEADKYDDEVRRPAFLKEHNGELHYNHPTTGKRMSFRSGGAWTMFVQKNNDIWKKISDELTADPTKYDSILPPKEEKKSKKSAKVEPTTEEQMSDQ